MASYKVSLSQIEDPMSTGNPILHMSKADLEWRVDMSEPGVGKVFLKKGDAWIEADPTKPAESFENVLAMQAVNYTHLFFDGLIARGTLLAEKIPKFKWDSLYILVLLFGLFGLMLHSYLKKPDTGATLVFVPFAVIILGIVGAQFRDIYAHYHSSAYKQGVKIRDGVDEDHQNYIKIMDLLVKTFKLES